MEKIYVKIVDERLVISDENDYVASFTPDEWADVDQNARYQLLGVAENGEAVLGLIEDLPEMPQAPPEGSVWVKIVEGTPYLSDTWQSSITMTQAAWEALDKSGRYAISGSDFIRLDVPVTPLQEPAKPDLQMMYIEAGAGQTKQIEALWELAVHGTKDMVEQVESLRKQVREQFAKSND